MRKCAKRRFGAVFLLASAVPAIQAGTVQVLGPAQVTDGSAFSVGIFANQISDLYAYQFDLSFDPTILQLLDIQEAPFLSSAGATVFVPGTIDNTLGLASFTLGSLVGPVPGASGSGFLANFDFMGLSGGTSQLDLSNVELLDSNFEDIPFSTVDGTVEVVTPEPFIPRWMAAVFGVCGFLVLRRRLAAERRRNCH